MFYEKKIYLSTLLNSNKNALGVIIDMKREAGGQGEFSGEFSVGLAARRDVASQPAT